MAGGHSRGGTTVAYGSHGGGGSSREPVVTTTPINDTNALRAQQNLQLQAALSAVANQQAQAAQRSSLAQAQNTYENPMVNQTAKVASSGAKVASATPTVQADPYADLYAIYQQKLDAQNAANEQRRAARLGALQSNYANAKSKLSDAFNSGETALNNDADNALRESYINMMLNQKRLNQQLESQGINGGAMESSLARAYNDYGNSRNSIEQGRMDALRELLSQYQGQLGDMESAYASNLADLDSDYFGNGLDFVTDYYDTIANLQAQNAASGLKNALGKKSASISTSDSTNKLDSNILNGLKNYKGNLEAGRAYLKYMGVPDGIADNYLMQGGFGADMIADGSLASYGITPTRTVSTSGISPSVRNTIINNLKRIYPTTSKDGLSSNESLYRNVINQLNQYAQQYGLSDAEAQAILAEAGF